MRYTEALETFKKTSEKNIFEDLITQIILENSDLFTDEDVSRINQYKPFQKRGAILRKLDKDRGLFLRIAEKALKQRMPKLEYMREVLEMLRQYVKVGEIEKKKYGEVMTPIDLVKDMLLQLPREVWTNPNLKWLDPCNGSGPFLAYVIKNLMFGLKTWEPDEERRYKHIIENMVYACELQPRNQFIYLCLVDPWDCYDCNVYTGSFLDQGFNDHMKTVWGVDKFDIILGNPPYQHGKDSNFYVKFIKKFYSISNMDSLLLFVVPNRFFQPSHKSSKIISDSELIVVYHNLNDYFPGISTHIGAFLLKNSKRKTDKVKCVFKNTVEVIDMTTPVPTDTSMSDIKYKQLLDKIIKSDQKLSFKKDSGNLFIKRQWKRWNSITKVGGDHVFNTVTEYDPIRDGNDGKWLDCQDIEKMDWYLSKSSVIRFLTKLFASAMNVPPFVWGIIPKIDLSQINSDEDLYILFSLTDEEIKIIKNNVK